jgi:hypothetical protein
MISNGGGDRTRTEEGKQMPLEVSHQKPNEPYFLNAMVFYELNFFKMSGSRASSPLSLSLSLSCFHLTDKKCVALSHC